MHNTGQQNGTTAHLAGAVEYTDYFYGEEKTLLYMTLNNLM